MSSPDPTCFSLEELLDQRPRPPLAGRQLDEVAFPLGGLGTGCISLTGWGQLRDFEIQNRPAKGVVIPQAFFTLRCSGRAQGIDLTKVLQGPPGGPYAANGSTLPREMGQGLPHFREVSFDGRYPVATVRFRDPKMPLRVNLEAFNPFIPGNDRDSGMPLAILIYQLKNPTDSPLEATIFGNLTNVIGEPSCHTRVNQARQGECVSGLWLTSDPAPGSDPRLGSLALASTLPTATAVRWPAEAWFSALDHFWQAVAVGSEFPPDETRWREATGDTGTVAVTVDVPTCATVEVPFLLAWHFPVVEHWRPRTDADGADATPTWTNWYAGQWADAWAVAEAAGGELERLRGETLACRDALFASTMPAVVLDAVSSQLSILRSPTCLRLPDGTFYGFEGCHNSAGCCEGSCTHVWNYAQALPYLFPALQRSMREADWTWSMQPDGYVTFRMPLPPGTHAKPDFHPCADGQMGTVLQVYREWLISGDDAWLERIWPQTRRALEYAWKYWDADRDGVMEGMQHNTYDIEYYGPNTMMTSLYLGALRAAEEMARHLGESALAESYRTLFESGSAWCDEHLFNGDYYEQQVEPEAWRAWPEEWQQRSIGRYGYDGRFADWPKWQVGTGCLSDQLLGQWYAEMLGLGKLFDQQHIRSALQAIVAHNWRPDLTDHPNPMRIYAVGPEAGLLLCTWPRGDRPGHPSVYADEAWSGIEYQVAAHLIYEGLVAEGLAIVKGVRDRYSGERRNPWDEIECGHHYARSMASYSLLLALAGFHYRGSDGALTLGPRLDRSDFTTFFSVDGGWGTASWRETPARLVVTVEPVGGEVLVGSLTLDGAASLGTVAARLGNQPVAATLESTVSGPRLCLAEPVLTSPGAPLTVVLGG